VKTGRPFKISKTKRPPRSNRAARFQAKGARKEAPRFMVDTGLIAVGYSGRFFPGGWVESPLLLIGTI
jgi:hypothetical protein